MRFLPILAALMLAGCAAESPSLRQDVVPPQEEATPKVAPWLMVEVGFAQPDRVAEYLRDVSGYARLVFAGGDWGDITQLELGGPINPTVRLHDADGDGRPDPTGELDVFSLGGGGEPILVWGGAANEGTRVRVGVIVYSFTGEPLTELWEDQEIRLEPREEPGVLRLGPVEAPSGPTPCYDGVDNDGDGWVDGQDSDCRGGGTLIERGRGAATCSDGVDNDGDGAIDAADEGCAHGGDLSELPSCEDGLDDDGDSWTDATDPDCQAGTDEQGFGEGPCNDGVDNDLDSFVDALDPGCAHAGATE